MEAYVLFELLKCQADERDLALALELVEWRRQSFCSFAETPLRRSHRSLSHDEAESMLQHSGNPHPLGVMRCSSRGSSPCVGAAV